MKIIFPAPNGLARVASANSPWEYCGKSREPPFLKMPLCPQASCHTLPKSDVIIRAYRDCTSPPLQLWLVQHPEIWWARLETPTSHPIRSPSSIPVFVDYLSKKDISCPKNYFGCLIKEAGPLSSLPGPQISEGLPLLSPVAQQLSGCTFVLRQPHLARLFL